ncbi:hypothetical protein V1264_011887 [Littorina saxatilis]|uniref:Uncharacterized protein n=1 Tax=Littorina saxatilis TaxID=31220 RepID=A0AAN9GKS5_9CAEN
MNTAQDDTAVCSDEHCRRSGRAKKRCAMQHSVGQSTHGEQETLCRQRCFHDHPSLHGIPIALITSRKISSGCARTYPSPDRQEPKAERAGKRARERRSRGHGIQTFSCLSSISMTRGGSSPGNSSRK